MSFFFKWTPCSGHFHTFVGLNSKYETRNIRNDLGITGWYGIIHVNTIGNCTPVPNCCVISTLMVLWWQTVQGVMSNLFVNSILSEIHLSPPVATPGRFIKRQRSARLYHSALHALSGVARSSADISNRHEVLFELGCPSSAHCHRDSERWVARVGLMYRFTSTNLRMCRSCLSWGPHCGYSKARW